MVPYVPKPNTENIKEPNNNSASNKPKNATNTTQAATVRTGCTSNCTVRLVDVA